MMTDEIEFREISDADMKGQIAEKILRSLPSWFGIEEAIVDYVEGVRSRKFLGAFSAEKPVGFVSMGETSPHANEIYVMGVLPDFHRRGIGLKLVEWCAEETRSEGKKFLLVKTLSSQHPDANYAGTRKFYLRAGFLELEELPGLWGKENPCLNMTMIV